MVVSTRGSPEKQPPAGIPTRRRSRVGTSRRDVVAPNHAYQCGKKMKSTYLETTVFLATVCPVRFFAPAKTTDGTF